MIVYGFGPPNGAPNGHFSRKLFIFEPLGADFGPIPTKKVLRPHLGRFLHNFGCFFDEFGKILAHFGIIFWQNNVNSCNIFWQDLGSIWEQFLAKYCKIMQKDAQNIL